MSERMIENRIKKLSALEDQIVQCIHSFGFYADSGEDGSGTGEYEDWIKNTCCHSV